MGNSIDVKLNEDFSADLGKFEKNIQDKVLFSGAAAMATVIYDEVLLNASPPRMGRVTGNLESSIYRVYSPERSSETQKTYRISWNKKKAPHGHLLEFGTSHAAAKPFLRPAFDKVDQAIEAGKQNMKKRLVEES
ncbi:HK97-gp10 family putative phage morphogenesis protein [Collimonas fungivorans]|uniref:HK97-gp10 family putative phage morphogenesis protein n=1 Tax=Collimonas fungivorans TaxID=158899 RepID=UPI000681DE7C|nr:HK97-gp10 family putative phage morphogenesis protein [Collimonas fungivorans]